MNRMKIVVSSIFLLFIFLFAVKSLKASITIFPNAKIDLNGNTTLNVSGNWFNDGGNLNSNECTIVFIGNSDSHIINASGEIFDYLEIDKVGADVILDDDITINSNLNFVSGNLVTTSSYDVSFGSNATISGETALKYLIGYLSITKNVGTGSSDFGGIGVDLASGVDNLGNVTIIRKSGNLTGSTINGIESIDRRWEVSSSLQISNERDITLSWNSADDNSSNLNFSKVWQSSNGSTNWETFGDMSNTSATRSITVPITELDFFTVSSTSTINLPNTFEFDEGNSLEVDFEDFISNLNSKNSLKKMNIFNQENGSKNINNSKKEITNSIFSKVIHKIVKNSKGKTKSIVMTIPNADDPNRSTSVSISGLDDVSASVVGMVVEFSAGDDWYGTDDIVVTVEENSKIDGDSKLSYYDDTQIIVNAVNDAPYIVSQFPIGDFATRQDSLTNMSIEVDDVDNSFGELSFIWEIDNINQEHNDSLFAHTFTVMGDYIVKAFVYDGLALDSVEWNVQVLMPSGIGGDDDDLNNLPTITKIFQNYPNPFNPTTKIDYQLHESSPVSITVYNQKGETVRRLVNKNNVEAGRYSISWDGKSDYGSTVSAGLYFYSIETSSYQNVKKAVMVK